MPPPAVIPVKGPLIDSAPPDTPPCVLFEDQHLLVVNKPPGLNTHAPAPYAGEGLYDWLRHREARWSALSILHRLDKETSGLMVFGKTTLANQSLTRQFTARSIHKKYLLLTDRPVTTQSRTIRSRIARAGERYVSRHGADPGAAEAETRFRFIRREGQHSLIEAEPLTGRTHQIRVHAAEAGFPILGDALYDGSPARRVCLHAAELVLEHPARRVQTRFTSEPDFTMSPGLALREALWRPEQTDCIRLAHGNADGGPSWYVDRLGQYLLTASEDAEWLTADRGKELREWMQRYGLRGVYHKRLTRAPAKSKTPEASPQALLGEPAPDPFTVRENQLHFELSFAEGYSVGLFLDQRENRRRLLVNHVAAGFPLFRDTDTRAEVLNTFAYTCAFSVAAARGGARTTSLDLSRKYLDWGQRNFRLNGLDPGAHDFIYGDVFDWLRRLSKKARRFDLILLDPPTFSRSKAHGSFSAERDYGDLVEAALPLLRPDGVLFASTNAAGVKPETFVRQLQDSVRKCKRVVAQQHYVPQPPDFPITREQPGYLKTVWMRVK